MSQFQAKTNNIIEQELEYLEKQMGLRHNQKAELLRELANIASWVVRQASRGRVIQAQGSDGIHTLEHPVLQRLQQSEQSKLGEPLRLSDEEVEKMAEILNRNFAPSESLRESLRRITDPDRRPPEIEWREQEN